MLVRMGNGEFAYIQESDNQLLPYRFAFENGSFEKTATESMKFSLAPVDEKK